MSALILGNATTQNNPLGIQNIPGGGVPKKGMGEAMKQMMGGGGGGGERPPAI